MNMDNYPHVTIAADGSLCSTGQHRPGFPRVLYDALRQLGYERDAPVYRGRMSMAHGQDKCEVNVVIPLNPMEPWMATIIGVELDETVEQTAQLALTSLCETRLADTAAMPIALFPIRNQEDPVWKQRLEAVSNPEGSHFHAGMAALAGYAQHLFNLQASTGRTVMRQQHVEELRRANAILRSGAPPPSDAAREMLDERTHVIIHLEHHIEQQDLDLEQRAATIADLEQQLLVLQL
jgi:hypothetical protein